MATVKITIQDGGGLLRAATSTEIVTRRATTVGALTAAISAAIPQVAAEAGAVMAAVRNAARAASAGIQAVGERPVGDRGSGAGPANPPPRDDPHLPAWLVVGFDSEQEWQTWRQERDRRKDAARAEATAAVVSAAGRMWSQLGERSEPVEDPAEALLSESTAAWVGSEQPGWVGPVGTEPAASEAEPAQGPAAASEAAEGASADRSGST
jgi:hypothetical protein